MRRLQHVGREIALAVDEHAQHQRIDCDRLHRRDPQIDDADAAGDREVRNAGGGRRLEERDVEDEAVARLAPELDEVDAVQRMRRIAQNAGAPLVVALQCAVRE